MKSLFVRDVLPADICGEALLQIGAVGDIIGHVLNADGEPVDHEINVRIIGISPDDLARIPNVILATGGLHKVWIILAALRHNLVHTLVIDEKTTAAILRSSRRSKPSHRR